MHTQQPKSEDLLRSDRAGGESGQRIDRNGRTPLPYASPTGAGTRVRDMPRSPPKGGNSREIGHMAECRALEIRPDLERAGMPKLAAARNVVHNDSRGQGALPLGTTKPPKGLRFLARNLMLNRSTGANRTGNPFGELCKALRCQKGAPAEATAIASRLGGPGRQTRTGAAPEGLRRHPDPLGRGAGRGDCRQHEHPVEGPATCEVADPTAGCGVCACGCGYPDHVATSWSVGVSGRPTDLHYKVLGPSGPSRLPSRSQGPLAFSIYVRRNHTATPMSHVPLIATCRFQGPQDLLTASHSWLMRRASDICR